MYNNNLVPYNAPPQQFVPQQYAYDPQQQQLQPLQFPPYYQQQQQQQQQQQPVQPPFYNMPPQQPPQQQWGAAGAPLQADSLQWGGPYPDRRPLEVTQQEQRRRREYEERNRPRQRMPIDQDFDNLYPTRSSGDVQQPRREPPPRPQQDDPYPRRGAPPGRQSNAYPAPQQQQQQQQQQASPPQKPQPPQQQEPSRLTTTAGKGEIVDAAVRLAETKGIPEHFFVYGIVTVGPQTLKTQAMRALDVGADAQRVVFQDVRDNDPGSIQIACLDQNGTEMILGHGEFDLRPGEHVCFLKAVSSSIPPNCRVIVRVGTRKQF